MKTLLNIALATSLILVAFVSLGQSSDTEEVLVKALQDEMQRSLDQLKEEGEAELYYIEYRVVQIRYVQNYYSIGSQFTSGSGQSRRLEVSVRVGSKNLDQTNFRGRSGFDRPYSATLPIEDDYDEIRRVAWEVTDQAYKDAINRFAEKQTVLASRTDEEERKPDFSEQEPFTHSEHRGIAEQSLTTLNELGVEISELFLDSPEIYSSQVYTTAAASRSVYINSEGSFNDVEKERCTIQVGADTQSEKGDNLRDSRARYSLDCDELAPFEEMKEDVKNMIANMKAMRTADPLDDVYFGPVMFEGQAGVKFLASELLPRLIAERKPLMANPNWGGMERNSFLDRVDRRVISAKVNVLNDPTMSHYLDSPLVGSYVVDEQGVKAVPTMLIENGILKSMLVGRTPVEDFAVSTGSNRTGDRFSAPGNVIIEPQEGLSDEEMRDEFLILLEDFNLDFGIVVRNSTSGNFSSRGFPQTVTEAYKVYADGTEELVGSVEVDDITERTLRDIVAVSTAVERFDTSLASNSLVPISIIAPSVLVEELTVRKVQGSGSLPPVVPHPFATVPTLTH